jgi:hypothetical protein
MSTVSAGSGKHVKGMERIRELVSVTGSSTLSGLRLSMGRDFYAGEDLPKRLTP